MSIWDRLSPSHFEPRKVNYPTLVKNHEIVHENRQSKILVLNGTDLTPEPTIVELFESVAKSGQ